VLNLRRTSSLRAEKIEEGHEFGAERSGAKEREKRARKSDAEPAADAFFRAWRGVVPWRWPRAGNRELKVQSSTHSR
jgi:hypothetical protein